MSDFIQCPSCKENIENDSCFCDQCGQQIFVCSLCGRVGGGKRCIFDGKEMIPATGERPSQTEKVQPQPEQQPVTPPAPPPVQQPPAPQSVSPAASDKIKLSSQNHGIIIEASDGDILGRSKGSFTGQLGRFSHISGSHCRITKTASVWNIVDMGSTNGTFYNNSRLSPNTPVPLQNNSRVKLADIEFVITYGENEGTVRL